MQWLPCVLYLSLLCTGGASEACAQASDRAATPALLRSIDSLVAAEYAKDSVGGVTVGLLIDARLVWTSSYGYADKERGRPTTRESVYRVASVTKMFTGLMLLQLVEHGAVRLSDSVATYFPEVDRIPGRPRGAPPVTLAQLATMTSGLAGEPRNAERHNVGSVAEWEGILIRSLPDLKYLYAPGTYHNYSNTGYAILAAALGRAASIPYVEYVRTHTLEPLGMRYTAFAPDARMRALLAKGYDVTDAGIDTLTSQRQQGNRGKNVAAGSLYSSVDDLARFVTFELGSGPRRVLSTAMLDSSFATLVAADADLNYGDGLGGFSAIRLLSSSYVAVGHLGTLPGYSAAVLFDRAVRCGVIVLANATNGKADYQELAQKLLALTAESVRTRSR